MKKSLRFISHTILGAALLAPIALASPEAKADDYYGYGYSAYYPGFNAWDTYNAYFPGYRYGYNGYGYYPGYNYGYNGYGYYPNYRYGYNGNGYYPNYYYGYNGYGYNGYYPDYNYGYDNMNPGYNNGGTYRYSNGYWYYILNDGSYYVYLNNRWVRGGTSDNNNSNTNTNSGYNRLSNDPHYRYENGYHYYVLDNGDYYYYSNGQWVFVKASTSDSATTSETGSTASSEAGSTVTSDAGSVAPSETGSTASSEAGSTVTSDAGSVAPSETGSTASSETGSTVTSDAGSVAPSEAGSTASSDANSTASSESHSSAPVTSETPNNGNDVSHPDYGPDPSIDYDKLPKPTLPPTDPKMQADPRFVDSDGTYYYVVAQTDEERERGIDGYYKWDGYRWVLHNGTASEDPGLNPGNHTHTEDSDYVYDDQASTFKVYSENVIGTGMAGDPLPFKTLDEFKDYVIRHYAPVFKDNAGWDCKVTWELEDADGFNNSKDAAWARDYVLVANLKSGVDKDEYKDTELGYVKFIYRVSPDVRSDYVELDSAKVVFNQINAERKANGLAELTWSDDLYNATTLPHAKEISRQYDSDGFVDRRETDGKVVANKWLNSGLRDLLLSPDAKEAAVACVVAGDGTYYWTLNYQ